MFNIYIQCNQCNFKLICDFSSPTFLKKVAGQGKEFFVDGKLKKQTKKFKVLSTKSSLAMIIFFRN